MIARLVSLLALALLPSGCGPGSGSDAIRVERNPTPAQAYRLNFRFHDAPGPLTKVRAVAYYRVENAECVKALPLSGAVLPPDHQLDLPLTILDRNRYEAVFHRNALRDADYFGLGLCRWKLQNVAIHFSSPSTDFVASLSNPQDGWDKIDPVQRYFLHRDYFAKPEPMTMVFGEQAGFYLASQGEQFRIEISADPL